jgi:ribosomal protein L21E
MKKQLLKERFQELAGIKPLGNNYKVGDKVKFNPSIMKDKGFEDLQQYYGGLIGVIEKVSQDELEIKLNKSITPPGGGNIDGILLMKSEGDYEMITK